MKDATMGNQQEIADVAWLAGMLNGDGCFSLKVRKRNDKVKRKGAQVDLSVTLTQTDGSIIEKAKTIMERITGMNTYIVEYPPCGAGKNTKMNLRYSKMQAIRKLLKAVEPFMVGNKAARARLIIEYIDRRLSLSDIATKKKNPLYDKVSWALVEKYYEAQGKEIPKDVSELLRD